jgi:hypothetical protein
MGPQNIYTYAPVATETNNVIDSTYYGPEKVITTYQYPDFLSPGIFE